MGSIVFDLLRLAEQVSIPKLLKLQTAEFRELLNLRCSLIVTTIEL
jgi:hypothetical protein